MRQIIIVLLLVVSFSQSIAQTVSLDSCIEWAYQAQKFNENQVLIRQGQVLSMENDKKMNLPTLVLDGSATYQNENITIQTPPVPGFESPNVPLNFNRLLINFNQTIYNGGLTAQMSMIDSLSYDSKTYQLEIDKIKVRSSITSLYSSIVLVREQQQIIARQIGTVGAKVKNLQGAIEAGVGYKSDLLNLKAEVLNLQQKATEMEYLERSLRQQLSKLTEHTISNIAVLELPYVTIADDGVEARPEFGLLNSQQNLLMAKSELSSASRMPYVGVFGNVGLGYPGYDIFNSAVSPMLMVGLKVNWKIVDWSKSKNEQQLIRWNQDIISYQYDRVKMQFESELIKQKQEIAKYEELITRDRQIVEMKKEVTQEISARLSGGTATSTDFLIQLNSEAVAELNESVHVIKLTLAKLSYVIIQGK